MSEGGDGDDRSVSGRDIGWETVEDIYQKGSVLKLLFT